jgi:hypothetical protein
MTKMIDTSGNEHEIRAIGNVATLESIGWTVKAVTSDTNVTSGTIPTTEREWDTIFGRR